MLNFSIECVAIIMNVKMLGIENSKKNLSLTILDDCDLIFLVVMIFYTFYVEFCWQIITK